MRILLSLFTLLMSLSISAQSQGLHPMLVEGKSWVYDYHHFEEHEDEPTTETVYPARYTILGDTLIDNTSYYKMYREVDNKNTYYAAYREDGLKVFARFPLINEDIIVADFEYKGLYDPDGYGDNDSYSAVEEYVDYIEVNGIKYRRHTYYEDDKENKLVIGVEGIGYTKYGLQYPSIYGPEPDCLCDHKVFTSCEMNGECIFTNEDFYKEAVAQGDNYIPFVEEGKAWICRDDYGIYGSLTGGDVIFTMTGDTEINGKTYKKVYLQFPGYFGDEEQHYHCAVREEDCKVFVVEPETEEENLLYDFSRPEEILELSYDDQTFVRNAGCQDGFCFPNQMHYRLYSNVDAINKGYSGIGDWIEGVGAIHVDPFAREFHVKESSKIPTAIFVQKCMNSEGVIIWKQPTRPTSIQETLNNTPISVPLYDLQGRCLTSQPSKGVFIKNGKKVVVR